MAEVSQMTPDEINEIITNNKIRLNTNDYKKLSILFPKIKSRENLGVILLQTMTLYNKIDKWYQGTTMFTKPDSNAKYYRYDCKKQKTNYLNIGNVDVCSLFHMQQKQIHNILAAALSSHPNPPLSFKEPILSCKIFLESIDSLKDSLGITNTMTKMTSMISRKSADGLFKDLLDSIESAFENAKDETFLKFKSKYKKLKDYFKTEQPFNNFLFGAITKDDRQTTRLDILLDTADAEKRRDISVFLNSIDQRLSSSPAAIAAAPSSPAAIAAAPSSPSTNFFSYFTNSRPTNNTDEILKSELDWHNSDGTRSNDNVSGDVTVTNGDGEEEEEVRIAPGASSTSNTGLTKDPRSQDELNRLFDANMEKEEKPEDGTKIEAPKSTMRSLLSMSWNRDDKDKIEKNRQFTLEAANAPGSGKDDKKETQSQRAPLIEKPTKKIAFNFGNKLRGLVSESGEKKSKASTTINPMAPIIGGKKTRKRRKPRKTRRKKQKKSKRKTKSKK